MSDEEIIPLTPIFHAADFGDFGDFDEFDLLENFIMGGRIILGEGDFWNIRVDENERERAPSPEEPDLDEERRIMRLWFQMLEGDAID